MGFFQTEISGYPIPWLQQHRITGNQVRGIYLMLAIGSHHPGFGGQHVTNGGESLFGLSLLDKAHQGLDNNDGQNNARIHPVAQARRNEGRRCQHINQEIFELPNQPRPGPFCPGRRQRIGAVTGKPLANLVIRQRPLCLQLLAGISRLKRVPFRLQPLMFAAFQFHRFGHTPRAPCLCNLAI